MAVLITAWEGVRLRGPGAFIFCDTLANQPPQLVRDRALVFGADAAKGRRQVGRKSGCDVNRSGHVSLTYTADGRPPFWLSRASCRLATLIDPFS